MWNYAKLCYNTKYPWEAAPNAAPSVEAQQYVLDDPKEGYLRGNTTFWCGERDGILYRRQFFHWRQEVEDHWIQAMNLADFPVAYGILRVDKTRFCCRPAALTLGSYGFPDQGTATEVKQGSYQRVCGGTVTECLAQAVVCRGTDRRGRKKQMAMTIYDGWKELDIVRSVATNPDTRRSVIVYAKMAYQHHYDATEPYVLISQTITKESTEDFSMEDLFPVRRIAYEDPFGTGAWGTVSLYLANGEIRKVNYEGIEGHMSL